jgi:hypothetical protein
MGNPETLIGVPLAAMTFLALAVGTLSERGYAPLGEWQFTEEQMDFVELAMRCTMKQPHYLGRVSSIAVGFKGEPGFPDRHWAVRYTSRKHTKAPLPRATFGQVKRVVTSG